MMRWCRRGLPAREDMDWTTKMLFFEYLRGIGKDWLEAGLYVGLFSLAEAALGGKRAASTRSPRRAKRAASTRSPRRAKRAASTRSLRRAKRLRTACEAVSGSLDWSCASPRESQVKEHADADRQYDDKRAIRASL